MTIRLRTAFLFGLAGILIWFLYIERVILTPFVLAAIFAYIFNPVINFFSQRIRFPRTISIIVIYLIILWLLVIFGMFLAGQIVNESSQLNNFIASLPSITQNQFSILPDWARPMVQDIFSSFEKLKIFSLDSILNFFPQAVSRVIGFFIFIFSGFYFLKEGVNMMGRLLKFAPNDYKPGIEILLNKINNVLSRYLRGQLLLVFLVSFALFIALSVLGIKFALILAIFSGFAEIVPIIGPIFATAVAALVVLIDGRVNFGLTPIQGAIAVVITYFLIRQIQDYFVTPHIMGKIVKLHPLVILFAVLAGEHVMGILGIILAVPIAATIRIILDFSLDKINDRGRSVK